MTCSPNLHMRDAAGQICTQAAVLASGRQIAGGINARWGNLVVKLSLTSGRCKTQGTVESPAGTGKQVLSSQIRGESSRHVYGNQQQLHR